MNLKTLLGGSLGQRLIRPKESPIYQVFAANTGLGKTVFSAGILASGVHLNRLNQKDRRLLRHYYYLKPVQTGFPVDSDSRFVQTFAPGIQAHTIFKYKTPVGPNVAAKLENVHVSDEQFLQSIVGEIEKIDGSLKSLGHPKSFVLLETAGGVNSPGISGTPQGTLYRAFRFPTVLIGDSKLGGVSTTLSSFESLMIRGFDTSCILMFNNKQYSNHEAIQEQVGKEVPVFVFDEPPAMVEGDLKKDQANLLRYFEAQNPQFERVLNHLIDQHVQRIGRLEELEPLSKKMLWWPFTQHKQIKSVTTIDSAYGDHFSVFQGKSGEEGKNEEKTEYKNSYPTLQFDASSSWWTQGVGHGNPDFSRELAYSAARYGHIIFPEFAHEPAVNLSEKLLKEGPGKGWAHRIFFSDNGSTATEIALKMAIRKSVFDQEKSGKGKIEGEQKWEVIGIQDSYHGDTIGAMDASSPNVFNRKIHWYEPKGYWFNAPALSMKNGKYSLKFWPNQNQDDKILDGHLKNHPLEFSSLDEVFALTRNDSEIFKIYRNLIKEALKREKAKNRNFGALIIEPVIHGANGMKFIDPLFQRALIREAKAMKIPVIFDEVFVGFYRLGPVSTISLLQETPNFACYSKLLSGGFTPFAVTLTTEEIFECYKGDHKKDSFLHGHSYTAYPIGCWAAAKAFEYYKASPNFNLKLNAINHLWDEKLVKKISGLENVNGVISIGTLFAVELIKAPAQDGKIREFNYDIPDPEKVSNLLKVNGIQPRWLGNILYLMASPLTNPTECNRLLEVLIKALTS